MPYILRKQKTRGYKVCKRGSRKCFSKRPLTKRMAKRQMRALYLHERVGKGHRTRHNVRGGGVEDTPTFKPREFNIFVHGILVEGMNPTSTIGELIKGYCNSTKRCIYSEDITLVLENNGNTQSEPAHGRSLADINAVNNSRYKLRFPNRTARPTTTTP